MPLISVIVPVYNAEKYLHCCIDSILSQTFLDFELLLVDDGSTDRSYDICNEYKKTDARVRVFRKPNGGVSSARNLGLNNAKGEWVTFVDSDDFIEQDSFERMSQNNGEDIVACSYQEFEGGNNVGKLEDASYNKSSLEPKLGDLLFNMAFMSPWGKLIRSSLLKKHKVRFDEDIASMEDTIFIWKCLIYADKVSTQSNIVYNYRITKEGLSSKNLSVDKAVITLDHFQEVFSALKKCYNKRDFLREQMLITNQIYINTLSFIREQKNFIIPRMRLLVEIHCDRNIDFCVKNYRPHYIGFRRRIWLWLVLKEKYFILTLYTRLYWYD